MISGFNFKKQLFRIAASIDHGCSALVQAKKAAHLGADLIELRIDAFSKEQRKHIANLISQIKQSSGLPVIATVRCPREQGLKKYNKLTEPERLEIFKQAIPVTDWVDVELNANRINRSVIQLAHQKKKKVILSYHDFNSIPKPNKLRQLVQKFKYLSGDILKIAVMPKTRAESVQFMQFCAELKSLPRVFIPMGKLGTIFRIAGFSFGSCLTYGHIGQAVASGQISIKDLVKYKKMFYPPQ